MVKFIEGLPEISKPYPNKKYEPLREELIKNPMQWAEIEDFPSYLASSAGALVQRIKKWPRDRGAYFEAAQRTVDTEEGKRVVRVYARYVKRSDNA